MPKTDPDYVRVAPLDSAYIAKNGGSRVGKIPQIIHEIVAANRMVIDFDIIGSSPMIN